MATVSKKMPQAEWLLESLDDLGFGGTHRNGRPRTLLPGMHAEDEDEDDWDDDDEDDDDDDDLDDDEEDDEEERRRRRMGRSRGREG